MVALFVLAACSSIDCPLNNRVYATFRLDAGMKTMEDTLTVAVPRAADYKDDDTVIINRLAGFDSIALPMSYQRAVDVYVFGIKQKDSDVSTTDTVWVYLITVHLFVFFLHIPACILLFFKVFENFLSKTATSPAD